MGLRAKYNFDQVYEWFAQPRFTFDGVGAKFDPPVSRLRVERMFSLYFKSLFTPDHTRVARGSMAGPEEPQVSATKAAWRRAIAIGFPVERLTSGANGYLLRKEIAINGYRCFAMRADGEYRGNGAVRAKVCRKEGLDFLIVVNGVGASESIYVIPSGELGAAGSEFSIRVRPVKHNRGVGDTVARRRMATYLDAWHLLQKDGKPAIVLGERREANAA